MNQLSQAKQLHSLSLPWKALFYAPSLTLPASLHCLSFGKDSNQGHLLDQDIVTLPPLPSLPTITQVKDSIGSDTSSSDVNTTNPMRRSLNNVAKNSDDEDGDDDDDDDESDNDEEYSTSTNSPYDPYAKLNELSDGSSPYHIEVKQPCKKASSFLIWPLSLSSSTTTMKSNAEKLHLMWLSLNQKAVRYFTITD
jgi:hypothetical protein